MKFWDFISIYTEPRHLFIIISVNIFFNILFQRIKIHIFFYMKFVDFFLVFFSLKKKLFFLLNFDERGYKKYELFTRVPNLVVFAGNQTHSL